jgi:hypothetical protein
MVLAFRDAFLAMTALSILGILLSWKLSDPVLNEHRASGGGTEATREFAAEM